VSRPRKRGSLPKEKTPEERAQEVLDVYFVLGIFPDAVAYYQKHMDEWVALLRRGWLCPEPDVRCHELKGHTGWHKNGEYSWEPGGCMAHGPSCCPTNPGTPIATQITVPTGEEQQLRPICLVCGAKGDASEHCHINVPYIDKPCQKEVGHPGVHVHGAYTAPEVSKRECEFRSPLGACPCSLEAGHDGMHYCVTNRKIYSR